MGKGSGAISGTNEKQSKIQFIVISYLVNQTYVSCYGAFRNSLLDILLTDDQAIQKSRAQFQVLHEVISLANYHSILIA